MRLTVNLVENSYDIIIKRGCLEQAGSEINLKRKILIVTDSGIPEKYIETVAEQCEFFIVETIPQGESNKNIEQFTKICRSLIKHNFTRTDAIVAIGGGVVGDLAGFAAACFMRGIDFYNIPTTLLAQIDSSVGGKTAINLDQVKNIVGAFFQPQKVLIDPDVLTTLPDRQKSSGMAEAIKMAATSNIEFFDFLVNENAWLNIEKVIIESLRIKIGVVEKDEKESNLRKVLNFGHTIGHAIESQGNIYHGEAISIGMLYFSSKQVKKQLITAFTKYNLPTKADISIEKIYQAILHDKKAEGNQITIVYVPSIGSFKLKTIPLIDLKSILQN